MRCVPHGVAENVFISFTFSPVASLSETPFQRLWTCPASVDKDIFPPPDAVDQSGSSPQTGVDNLFPTPVPFSTENAVFLSTATAFAPKRERMSPTFRTRTGHSTACPRSVHCLFHRSRPVACRKMPGQARIFGFSTVSRPLTAVTAERYTDRQIDCSP